MYNSEFISKLQKGPLYLLNDFDDFVLKILPDEKLYYAKFKGGKEYRIAPSTNLAMFTIYDPIEISEEEYDKF